VSAILEWFQRYPGRLASRGGGGAGERELRLRRPAPAFGEPGAGLALRFGDLAGAHLVGDVGAALLAELAAVQCR
jgi:hypothetical protein